MTTYPNLAAIDGAGYEPDTHCKITFPYEVGMLSVGTLDQVIERATVEGVTVRNEKFYGGIFVKQGRLHAEGRWRDVRVLLAAVEQLARDLDEE